MRTMCDQAEEIIAIVISQVSYLSWIRKVLPFLETVANHSLLHVITSVSVGEHEVL